VELRLTGVEPEPPGVLTSAANAVTDIHRQRQRQVREYELGSVLFIQ
jgi:hypothetical protein